MTNVKTKAQLIEALNELETQMEYIISRTGCPESFLPIDKMAHEIGVSKSLILFAVEQNGIKGRVYSTATGGHIINCKGYPINKTKEAVSEVIKASIKVTKTQIKHISSGRVFGGGKLIMFAKKNK